MDSLHFFCTLCGQCCHNHSLPLTIEESISWLEDKGTLAIYCEAIHSIEEPLAPRTEHRKRRGFAANCGTSTIYVTAILVGVNSGACHNLGEDMKCRIYERRPLVCRVYPAEISPFIQLDPANKACPPEAWLSVVPESDGFAKHLPSLAEQSRQTDYREAARKGVLCDELGVQTTALADEGYVRHLPDPVRFLAALKLVSRANAEVNRQRLPWVLYSPTLTNSGLNVISEKATGADYQFLRA